MYKHQNVPTLQAVPEQDCRNPSANAWTPPKRSNTSGASFRKALMSFRLFLGAGGGWLLDFQNCTNVEHG